MADRRAGFTLIELLVVIGIIALLAGMLMPVINIVRGMAITSKCMSNLRQQAVAFMTYSSDFDGYLPAPLSSSGAAQLAGWNANLSVNYGTGKPTLIATDTDQTSGDGVFVEPLYRRLASMPITDNRHYTGYGMNLYLPPSILGPIETDWGVARGTNPILPRVAEAGRTVLVADTTNCRFYPDWGCTYSLDTMNSNWHFQNLPGYVHQGKANFLFVDGHVEPLSSAQAYSAFTSTMAYLNNLTW